MQHVEERLSGKAFEQFVQPARAEHQQHHQAVVVRAGLGDAGLFAHDGATAVASDDVGRAHRSPLAAIARGKGDGRSVVVLHDLIHGPAVERFDRRQFGNAMAQHRLGLVLRQPFVVGEVERPHQFALQPVIVIAADERAIGGHAADSVFLRDRARAAQRLLGAPEMEMLHGPLGQVLSAGHRLRLGVPFDHGAAYAALAKLDRQAEPDRPTADDNDPDFGGSGCRHGRIPIAGSLRVQPVGLRIAG